MNDLADVELRMAAVVAAMVAKLEPHGGSLEQLWAHMPEAFQSATGRAVDRADAHDLMLCHAALSNFKMEESLQPN